MMLWKQLKTYTEKHYLKIYYSSKFYRKKIYTIINISKAYEKNN